MLLILLLDQMAFNTKEYKLPIDTRTECWVITTNFRVEDFPETSSFVIQWKREPSRVKWIDGRQCCNAINSKGWDVQFLLDLYRPSLNYDDPDLMETNGFRIENATKQTQWFWTPFGDGFTIHKHPKKWQQ